MNILSLFDGLSGGQIALRRAGIEYDNYFASEIESFIYSFHPQLFLMLEDDLDDHEKILNKKLTTEERAILQGDDITPPKKKIKITPAVKQKLLEKLTAEQIEELKKTDYHHVLFLKQFTPEERKVIYKLCLGERLNKTEAVVYTGMQKKLKESAYDRNHIVDLFQFEIEREAIEVCISLSNAEIEILAVIVRKKLLAEE